MTTKKNTDFVEILLVEDSKHDAELTLLALAEENLANHVVWLKDGKEALDFLFAKGEYDERNVDQHPRVILLDLKMPRVDGLEVLREIRANDDTKHIPVVVLTSSKEEKDIVETYHLGVNSFIVKPVEFDNFSQCVKEIGLYWAVVNQPPQRKKQSHTS